MLSRVAKRFGSDAGYVEREEGHRRCLKCNSKQVLEDPGRGEVHACAVLLAIMGVPGDTAKRVRDQGRHGAASAMTRTRQAQDRRRAVRAWQRTGAPGRCSRGIWEAELTHKIQAGAGEAPGPRLRTRRSYPTSESARPSFDGILRVEP